MKTINSEMKPWLLLSDEEKAHFKNPKAIIYVLNASGKWVKISGSRVKASGCIYKCEIPEQTIREYVKSKLPSDIFELWEKYATDKVDEEYTERFQLGDFKYMRYWGYTKEGFDFWRDVDDAITAIDYPEIPKKKEKIPFERQDYDNIFRIRYEKNGVDHTIARMTDKDIFIGVNWYSYKELAEEYTQTNGEELYKNV